MAKNSGFFITFEGGEGAGKSTQIRHLKSFLQKKGYSVILTLEPGGSRLGKKIREILLNPKNKTLSHRAELLLYEADRAQHVEEVILPALKKGKVIISDRFMDSSTVYQGICRNFGIDFVKKLNQFATYKATPNLTLLFDIPETIGRQRVLGRFSQDRKLKGKRRVIKLDRLERENLSFHRKVRLGFLKIAKSEPRRIKTVDATLPVEKIRKQIEAMVLDKLR